MKPDRPYPQTTLTAPTLDELADRLIDGLLLLPLQDRDTVSAITSQVVDEQGPDVADSFGVLLAELTRRVSELSERALMAAALDEPPAERLPTGPEVAAPLLAAIARLDIEDRAQAAAGVAAHAALNGTWSVWGALVELLARTDDPNLFFPVRGEQRP